MRPLTQIPQFAAQTRFPPWIVFLGATVIPLIYLPTLGTRFDFIDDVFAAADPLYAQEKVAPRLGPRCGRAVPGRVGIAVVAYGKPRTRQRKSQRSVTDTRR
jgi:hypothetical protein